jgi:hypothetical protein
MGGQVFALISQYLVIFGVLIGLFLIMKKPEVLSQVINSINNLNTSAITAFKK